MTVTQTAADNCSQRRGCITQHENTSSDIRMRARIISELTNGKDKACKVFFSSRIIFSFSFAITSEQFLCIALMHMKLRLSPTTKNWKKKSDKHPAAQRTHSTQQYLEYKQVLEAGGIHSNTRVQTAFTMLVGLSPNYTNKSVWPGSLSHTGPAFLTTSVNSGVSFWTKWAVSRCNLHGSLN